MTTAQPMAGLPGTGDYAPGIYPNMTFEQYAAIPAVNPSSVKDRIACTPRGMLAKLRGYKGESSDSLELGTLAHLAILEPDEIPRRCAIWTGGTRRGKAWDAFRAANPGRLPVTEEQYDTTLRMRDAMQTHPQAAGLLGQCKQVESATVWRDKATGLLCKGKPDAFSHHYLIDVKTIRACDPRLVESHTRRYGYDVQMAAYTEGLNANGCKIDGVFIIFVSTDPAHEVVVYQLQDDLLADGRAWWKSSLHQIGTMYRTGVVPWAFPDIEPLCLPEWARKQTGDPLTLSIGGEEVTL